MAPKDLSIYLLLDTSASMFGAPLQALKDNYQLICRSIQNVFAPWQSIRFSALAYDSALTPLFRSIHDPLGEVENLTAGGTSALGAAWHQALVWIEEDSATQAALMFLLTDGPGTDDWQVAMAEQNELHIVRLGVGCGRHAKLDGLKVYLSDIISPADYDKVEFEEFLRQHRGLLE